MLAVPPAGTIRGPLKVGSENSDPGQPTGTELTAMARFCTLMGTLRLFSTRKMAQSVTPGKRSGVLPEQAGEG